MIAGDGLDRDEVDLNCQNRQRHAVLYPEAGVVEMKCNRSYCGARKGVVVLHRWNTNTGELTETLRFAEPTPKKGT